MTERSDEWHASRDPLHPTHGMFGDPAGSDEDRRKRGEAYNARRAAMSDEERAQQDRIMGAMGHKTSNGHAPEPDDPFAPLPPKDEAAMPSPKDLWEWQNPAPEEPPEAAAIRHSKWGVAQQRWVYRNAEGQPIFAAARFERVCQADGKIEKEVFPYSYGMLERTTKAGNRRRGTGWHFKRPCVPVPMYGLDRLAARPDAPVILFEGEKKADAARELFPEHVGVSGQGGASNFPKVAWGALAGRTVVIWPDQDQPGRKFAQGAKLHLAQAGAAAIAIVDVPTTWPEGWDVADALPNGVTVHTLHEMLAAASGRADDPDAAASAFREAEVERLSKLSFTDYQILRKDAANALNIGVTALDKLIKAEKAKRAAQVQAEARRRPPPGPGQTQWPSGITMRADGLYAELEGDAPDVWICPPFAVLGQVRDTSSEEWGLWLRWLDPDGHQHVWCMPSRLLAVSPGELEAELVARGFRINVEPGARTLLRQALGGVTSGNRVRSIERAGWHTPLAGDAVYVLPTGDVIGTSVEQVVLARVSEAAKQMGTAAGSLQDWQTEVAAKAAGNSILTFCICAAFSGALLMPFQEASGGFHLVGRSKIGKTLVAIVAASVWGSPKKGGVVRDWRSTSNGLEMAASESNDGFLVLDEIHQVEPRDLVSCIYMLMNEAGKQRATKLVTAAQKKVWSVIVISNGETDLASIAARANHPLPAGAQVRMPSIPVDASMMWPELHGEADTKALMARLQHAVRHCHGMAGRAFLERLVKEWANSPDTLVDGLEAVQTKFRKMLSGEADAQVHDVARRCALFATAGELAINWGILPWKQGAALKACKDVLTLWIRSRGGSGSTEDAQHVQIVRTFIALHGASRFVHLKKEQVGGEWVEVNPERQVLNRAGWRRPDSKGDDEYLIQRDVWRQLCAEAGANPTEAAQTLKKAGFLGAGDGSNLAASARVPGIGKDRFYMVTAGLMASDRGDPV